MTFLSVVVSDRRRHLIVAIRTDGACFNCAGCNYGSWAQVKSSQTNGQNSSSPRLTDDTHSLSYIAELRLWDTVDGHD